MQSSGGERAALLSTETIGSLKLDDFVLATSMVYRHHDEKRSVWDVWLHACHHASSLSRSIQRRDGSAPAEIAYLSMWLFTFVHRIGGTIGTPLPGDRSEEETIIRTTSPYAAVLWRNFPGLCPDCYWRRSGGGDRALERIDSLARPCDCGSRNPTDQGSMVPCAAAVRDFADRPISNRPSSMDEWQAMFAAILSASPTSTKITSLLEQFGQAGDAMVRLYTYSGRHPATREEVARRYIRFERELSEVTALIFSLAQADIFGPRDSESPPTLSRLVWQQYGSEERGAFVCSHCESCPCGCDIRFVPSEVSAGSIRQAAEPDN